MILMVGLAILLLVGEGGSAQEGAARIAGAFALFGLAVGWVQGFLRDRQQRSQAVKDTVFRELARFSGGIQERNIGISVVGHYWSQLPELEGVFVRVLTNQAIYILAHGHLDRAHELSNLNRIIDLLAPVKRNQDYKTFVRELVDALGRRARRNGIKCLRAPRRPPLGG